MYVRTPKLYCRFISYDVLFAWIQNEKYYFINIFKKILLNGSFICTHICIVAD